MLSGCEGLTISCETLYFHGIILGRTAGVQCEVSNALEKNVTAAWMHDNCTSIGSCTTEGCVSRDNEHMLSASDRTYLLYNTWKMGGNPYLFSVLGCSCVVALSNANATSNISTGVSCNTPTSSPTSKCSCVDKLKMQNDDDEPEKDDDDSKDGSWDETDLQVDNFNKTVSTISTMTAGSHIRCEKDVNGQSIPPYVLAIIITGSSFSVISCICTSYLGCRTCRKRTYWTAERSDRNQQSRSDRHDTESYNIRRTSSTVDNRGGEMPQDLSFDDVQAVKQAGDADAIIDSVEEGSYIDFHTGDDTCKIEMTETPEYVNWRGAVPRASGQPSNTAAS